MEETLNGTGAAEMCQENRPTDTLVLQEQTQRAAPVHLTLSHLPLDLQDNILYNKLNIIADKGVELMIAANYSTVRDNLKQYCDQVSDCGETVIVTRKNKKNVVIISLEQWNALERAARNAEYLSSLDRSFDQLRSGRGTLHELIEEPLDE